MKKEKILMSYDNPDGQTLEYVLEQLSKELEEKTTKIPNIDQTQNTIRKNNRCIVGLFKQALALQQESQDILELNYGENKGAKSPRVGNH